MQSPPDRYQLVRRLRATPQVQSYEARHPRRPGRFLVEVLGSLQGEGPAREAFERDLAAISQLRHPYMLQTLELSQLPDGTPIMVSELPDGQTLQVWLDGGVVAPLPSVLGLIDAPRPGAAGRACAGRDAWDAGCRQRVPGPEHGFGAGHPPAARVRSPLVAGSPSRRSGPQDMSAFAALAGRLLNTALPGLEDAAGARPRSRTPAGHRIPRGVQRGPSGAGPGLEGDGARDDAGAARPPGRRRRSVVRMGLSASGLVTAASSRWSSPVASNPSCSS